MERRQPQHDVWSNRNGELVGHDEFGNAYYRAKGRDRSRARFRAALGHLQRRGGSLEDPAGLERWLHQTYEIPPAEEVYAAASGRGHIPNLTGTPAAYRPKGSILGRGRRQATDSDYQAWNPSP